jgi:V/A-type H+-transporting ATPase subunit I
MIRPQPARWFETLCAREDALAVLEALAATGCVEIEWPATREAPGAAQANRRLREYAELARRYRAYWPRAQMREAAAGPAPAQAFESALRHLADWAAEAEPRISEVQELEGLIGELATLERVIDALEASGIDLSDLVRTHAGLEARVLVYPEGADPSIPGRVLLRTYTAGRETVALLVGEPVALAEVEREAAALHARAVALPAWLDRDAAKSRALIGPRREAAARALSAARATLVELAARHEVAMALGDVARAAWCFQNAGAIDAGEGVFARVNGWTDDAPRIAAAVDASGARALVSFPPAPAGRSPPLVLRNPWWARPFELFTRLFGMPSREGADPSAALAVVSPLLFGYMFGDVGQGLVLIAAGLALRRRSAAFRLLIPGGIAAVAFGLLFGSVFGLEGAFAPLWLAPLESPLAVLAVPVAAGAALLSLGLVLNALEAYWRHAFTEWLLCDAGFAAVYLGLLVAPFHAAGVALGLAGAVAFIAGRAFGRPRPGAALAALGALLERTLQILVNTLSFARVGAFALAHAGLSAAVVALAQATGNRVGYLAALVAGNAIVIVLEGLVVGIQTTRLILFEFFVRFFESRGRELRPLLPPITPEESQ